MFPLFAAAFILIFLAFLVNGLYIYYRNNIAPRGRYTRRGGGSKLYDSTISSAPTSYIHSSPAMYDSGAHNDHSGWGGLSGGGGSWDSGTAHSSHDSSSSSGSDSSSSSWSDSSSSSSSGSDSSSSSSSSE